MIPKWGTAAILVAPPAPLLSTGFVAGNTLPAQFWNYMFFHLTAELLNVLAAGGVSQNAAIDTQLRDSIGILAGNGVTLLSSGSPYAVALPITAQTYLVLATTNPYVMNLPAGTGSGAKIRIVDYSALATGLVQIVPHGSDNIGSAGNVSCYLQNVDQSGFVYKYQWIELTDTVAGTWDVTGGQFCPAQSVDTNGQQYHLGKLHHLPLGNTTSRLLFSGNPTTTGVWSAAQQASGVVGVPLGAKAIKAKIYILPYATGAGQEIILIGFSDNNSNVPSTTTAHAVLLEDAYAGGAGAYCGDIREIDIPLNASGQFYFQTLQATNVTMAITTLQIFAVGYYMGD